MSEMSEQPIFSPEQSRQVGVQVGEQLLNSNSYADLRIEDLENEEVIRKGESYPEEVARLHGLNRRIVDLAWESLLSRVPAPSDGEAANVVVPKMLVSETEERDVRLPYLIREDSDSTDKGLVKTAYAEAKGDLQGLALEIVNLAQEESNIASTPESLKGDISDPRKVIEKVGIDRLMNMGATMVPVGELGFCFAIPIPSEKSVLGAMLPPALSEYIVITDPELNSQIADSFFASPAIVKAYLLDEIGSGQWTINRSVESKFSSVALKKYPELEAKLEGVNGPLKKHVYELLEKEAEKEGSVYVTEIFRDHHDYDAMLGKAEPKMDRVGSESGAKVFKVSPHEEGLLFEWESQVFEITFRKAGEPRSERKERPPKYETKSAIAYLDGDEVKFRDVRQPEELDASPEDPEDYFTPKQVSSDYDTIEYFFDWTTKVLSMKQLQKLGNHAVEEAKGLVGRLGRTISIGEYFARIKETRIWPGIEYFASKSPGFIRTDETTLPPSPEIVRQN